MTSLPVEINRLLELAYQLVNVRMIGLVDLEIFKLLVLLHVFIMQRFSAFKYVIK